MNCPTEQATEIQDGNVVLRSKKANFVILYNFIFVWDIWDNSKIIIVCFKHNSLKIKKHWPLSIGFPGI